MMILEKIISGGQTGADQAGLTAALTLGLKPGGTVPKGRMTDDGPLSDEAMRACNLVEHRSPKYPPRTRANVRDSDATVLFGNMGSPGCRLTIRYCVQYGKKFMVNPTPAELGMWLRTNPIRVLNVAGNRERKNPGIYNRTLETILEAYRREKR